jgi:hypothetical protein
MEASARSKIEDEMSENVLFIWLAWGATAGIEMWRAENMHEDRHYECELSHEVFTLLAV